MTRIKVCDRCGSKTNVDYIVKGSYLNSATEVCSFDLCESCLAEYLRFIGGQLVEPLPKKEA